MIKHILTMLYNQKKKFTAVVFEQVLVFIALSVSLAVTLDLFRSYRSPGMLDVDNVIGFGYLVNKNHDGQAFVKSAEAMDAVKEKLEKKPYVEGISECMQILPYQRPAENYWADSVSFASAAAASRNPFCSGWTDSFCNGSGSFRSRFRDFRSYVQSIRNCSSDFHTVNTRSFLLF